MSLVIRRTPNSSMIRRTCVLVSMLALFLQGSMGGHMLLVEHSRCAEHGELVHNGESHLHFDSAQLHGEAVLLHGTPDPGSENAHEHCSLSADRRDAVVSVSDTNANAATDRTLEHFGASHADHVPQLARFLLAPKTSPPA